MNTGKQPWTGEYYRPFGKSNVVVTRERYRRDRRYLVLTVRDGDQILREFGKDFYEDAISFADGFATAKAAYDEANPDTIAAMRESLRKMREEREEVGKWYSAAERKITELKRALAAEELGREIDRDLHEERRKNGSQIIRAFQECYGTDAPRKPDGEIYVPERDTPDDGHNPPNGWIIRSTARD